MAETLASIARTIQPSEVPIVINAVRAEDIRRQMDAEQDFGQRKLLQSQLIMELLAAGKTEMALAECEKFDRSLNGLESALSGNQASLPAKAVDIHGLRALAYLRLAEEQNCCSSNNPESCLVPIKGAGIHSKREGSLHAMEELEGILTRNPDDLISRWLLNVAAMTVAKYPEGVPSKWRIDPKIFRSDFDIKRFPNIAPQLGLNLVGRAGGAIVDDLDNDGYLDIMISGTGFSDPLQFFHNNGDATFTDRTKETGLTGITGGLNLIEADYDNDSRTDVFVLRGGWLGQAGRFPCSLLHNDGNGKFTDVTRKAGLFNPGPTQTGVWFDYNNDGLLDLFIGYEVDPLKPHPCALYRNNGNGTFTEVAEKAGVNLVGMVKSVVSADYDNDGWADLLLSSRGNGYVLYHNNGDGTFKDVTAGSGITKPQVGFGCFFFDYDNDGWPDIFVVDYDLKDLGNVIRDLLGKPVTCDRSRLYHNNHHGGFTDVSHAAHVDKVMQGMGMNFGDLDNDGWLDFYVGTGNPNLRSLIPNRMFRNAGGTYFQDVTTSGDFGHLQKGHGVAFADINNDGQQDVFEEMGGAVFGDVAYSTLYANPGHGNHWITLRLEGKSTNRSAIGTRIKLTVVDGGRKREIFRTVGSGASFGCNPLRQEIGIGRARRVERIEIYWPVARTTQVFTNLASDRFYQAHEGSANAEPIKLRSTPWATAITRSHRSSISSAP